MRKIKPIFLLIGCTLLIMLGVSFGYGLNNILRTFSNGQGNETIGLYPNITEFRYASIFLSAYVSNFSIKIKSTGAVVYNNFTNSVFWDTQPTEPDLKNPENATDKNFSTLTHKNPGSSSEIYLNISYNLSNFLPLFNGSVLLHAKTKNTAEVISEQNTPIPINELCVDPNNTLNLNIMIDDASGGSVKYYCRTSNSPFSYLLNTNTSTQDFYEQELFILPSAFSLYLSDTRVFIENINISLNISDVNNIIKNDCSCTNCSILPGSPNVCNIPIGFNLLQGGNISYSDLVINLSLNIDNCSSIQSIPSNGTALNITYYDQTGAITNINTTIQIESLANYSVSYNFKNNTQICVYPSWYNESATLNIYYTSSGAQNVYTTTTTLNNVTQQLSIISQQDAALQTILTYKDINTQAIIPNVYITVSRFVGGNWILVASGYTDISGKFQFNYVANTRYKFTSTVANYKDYSFELNPIISSSYDIKITPSVAEANIPKFYRATYDFNPKTFKNGLTNFNVTFTSTYGDLTYYGYTLIFPNGGFYYQSSDSGTTPTGSKLTSGNFVINATLPNDYVRIDLFYDTDISPFYNTTLYFTVSAPTVNNTFMNLKDNHYGMGILERTIIALLIVLFVVGLSTLAGQPVFGVALGLFVYGFFVYIGFLPIWSVIVSFIIGFLIVAGREAGF